MAFLAPLFFVGLAAIAIPVIVHLIQRERKDIIEFPSLMFIRKIPYQSVERRRIHNWPLLLLRAAAMALLVAAFSRPFFTEDPVRAAAATTGAREVMILLDRSASMGYGDHWARAQAEARKVVATLSGQDRGTLVLFDDGPEEAVRATSDRGTLEVAIDQARVASGGTRFAPALRLAQSAFSRSPLPRKEAYLISDFQKAGWQRQEEIHLPEGATITPVSVADLETSDLSVTSVALQRASFAREERVTITAGLTNRSATAVTRLPVRLEIDGRLVATRDVTIGPNASGSVVFEPVTVADANIPASIKAGTDALPADNVFHFVLTPSRPLSVLVIQGEDNASLYLSTALSIGASPPFTSDVLSPARVNTQSFDRRSVVVLNDATSLSSATIELLTRFVEQGGGLLVGLGARNAFGGDSPLLPAKVGAIVDRRAHSGGTLGWIDFSHPLFEPFKEARNGNFTASRYFQYRTLTPGKDDRVLAKFDDGAVAIVERRVGSGRVIAFASTLDTSWTDFPVRAMYLPMVHGLMRYLGQFAEPDAWYTVGRMLDISTPIAQIVREGGAVAGGKSRVATGVVVSPKGEQVTLGEGGVQSIALDEQGFYAVRLQGVGDRRPFQVAVNLDPAEAELSALSPQDFLAGVTGRSTVATPGQSLEHPELTVQDVEKKQSIWWFLLLGAVLALVGEAVLSNRLSKQTEVGAGARA